MGNGPIGTPVRANMQPPPASGPLNIMSGWSYGRAGDNPRAKELHVEPERYDRDPRFVSGCYPGRFADTRRWRIDLIWGGATAAAPRDHALPDKGCIPFPDPSVLFPAVVPDLLPVLFLWQLRPH
jgi:hypothetical protein